jgi:hypothetical protein
MAIIVLSFIYALFFSVAILATNTINGNPFRLTLRGRRVTFVFALLVGFIIAQYTLHIEWNCDLRPNHTQTSCEVAWK